ncbi:MAG: hypothetical protein CMP23_09500 [Rickettsiales bacterium]|nr:hypothetical protein [Rickettsiales bacterium]|tara:strand:+ start:5848 stop:6423 length:576 start_codon:yes stop_codon:yes gene_type:complete
MARLFVLLVTASLTGMLVGCDAGPWDAPPYAAIDEVEDIQVAWQACRLDPLTGGPQTPGCENDPPIIMPLNVMVRDARYNTPLNNVKIWYASGHSKIYLLPQEVVEVVGVPDTERWDYVTERGDTFAEFSNAFDGDYRPTFYQGWTDDSGLSSVWLFIEEMPMDDTGQARESGILISIGVDTLTVKLGVAA